MKKVLRSKIFHNFTWQLLDKVVRLVLSLFVSVLVARYLGAEGFGVWNYLLSITMFFTSFVGLGFASVLPRELVNQNEREEELVSMVFIIRLLSGFVGFLLNILLFFLFKQPDQELLMMAALMASLLIFQSAESFDIYFKTRLQSKYPVYARNAAFVLVALLKLYFIKAEFPLLYFVATNSLEFLLGGVFIIGTYLRLGNHLRIKNLPWHLSKALLRDGFPMMFSSMMVMLYMRVDQVMLTDMAGERQNGIYATGVRMIEVVYFIPIALSDSFFPGIVYAKKNEGEKYEKNLLGFYSIMTYISLVIGLVTYFIAIPMMDLLFGDEFSGSGRVLQIFSFSIYATFMMMATGKFLVAENYLRVLLSRSFLGLVANLLLNFYLIPTLGFIGAAYASFLSYFVPIMVLALFKRSRGQLKLMLKAFDPRVLKDRLELNKFF